MDSRGRSQSGHRSSRDDSPWKQRDPTDKQNNRRKKITEVGVSRNQSASNGSDSDCTKPRIWRDSKKQGYGKKSAQKRLCRDLGKARRNERGCGTVSGLMPQSERRTSLKSKLRQSKRTQSDSSSESSEPSDAGDRGRQDEREVIESLDSSSSTDGDTDACRRKVLKRKLREKMAAYEEKLSCWLKRERLKAKQYEKQRKERAEKQAEDAETLRLIKSFLKHYRDQRDDEEYYTGAALHRRMKYREAEMERDLLDKYRELYDLDELKQKSENKGRSNGSSEERQNGTEEKSSLPNGKAALVSPAFDDNEAMNLKTLECTETSTAVVIDSS